MFKDIITVTLSPCLDCTLWVDDFYYDDPIRVLDERTEAGGKGLNVSRVLNGIGVKNTAICAVGEDNANAFEELALQSGVKVSSVYCKGKVRENITVIAPDQKLMKLNRTSNFDVDEVISGVRQRLCECIKASDKPLVHFGGSLPKGMLKAHFTELMTYTKALGALLSVDSSVLTIDDYATLSPFLIKPNIMELSKASCKELNCCESDILEAVKPLVGKVDNILVSMGDKGIMRVDELGCTHINAPVICTRTTVGAGDSAIAGYLYGLQQGDAPNQTLKLAAACGACACELDTAGGITLQKIKTMLERLERQD